MTSSTVRPPVHVCQCDQYHASLQHTSLILDIHLLIDTCQNKVSADQYHMTISRSQAQAHLGQLTRYWFSIELQAQHSWTFKRGFILRALSVARRGYTTPLYINESSYTVNSFRVQVENGFSSCIFRWFQSSLTYHYICGPNWWLRGCSSQASAGCKLVFDLNLLRAAFFSALHFLAYL